MLYQALCLHAARAHTLFSGCRFLAALTAVLACRVPFAAAQPLAVPLAVNTATPATGSLLIAGGGLLPENVLDRFLKLGGGEKANVVVIPTASRKVDTGIENLASYSYWAPLAQDKKVATVCFLHTRKREEANDPKFVKPLKEASAVWFTGGDQELLTDVYKNTAVEREVRAVVKRGGVVGGTSAGAAVMSEVMIRFGNPVAETGAGFGLIDRVIIDQHFQERNRLPRLLGVLTKYPKYLGLGIDEQTAIEVSGQRLKVLGARNVRLCLPSQPAEKNRVQILASGTEIDLAEFSPDPRQTPPVAVPTN